jgi:hypothetical protein
VPRSEKPDAAHPFVRRLRALPENFPEIAGGDVLARTARMVILPQMVRAASLEPERFRAQAVSFLMRFVVALEVAPHEIYGDSFLTSATAEAAKAPAIPAVDPADRTAPDDELTSGNGAPAEESPTAATTPAPLDPTKLERILAGE